VAITWTAPAIAPVKYKIYLDEVEIGETTTTEYKDDVSTLDEGDYTYKYCVLPVYAAGVCAGTPDKKCVDVTFHISVKEFTSGVSIAPNPAYNNITIKAKSNFHTVEIVSFLGQIILSQSNETDNATLDVSQFTSGVYFVRVISENGISVQKFVKQ
jgi:hypothetical protein